MKKTTKKIAKKEVKSTSIQKKQGNNNSAKGSKVPYALSWEPSPSPDVVSYNVTVQDLVAGKKVTFTTRELFQVVHLDRNHHYEIAVFAVNKAGNSSSAIKMFVDKAKGPLPPQHLLLSSGEEGVTKIDHFPDEERGECVVRSGHDDDDIPDDGDDGMNALHRMLEDDDKGADSVGGISDDDSDDN